MVNITVFIAHWTKVLKFDRHVDKEESKVNKLKANNILIHHLSTMLSVYHNFQSLVPVRRICGSMQTDSSDYSGFPPPADWALIKIYKYLHGLYSISSGPLILVENPAGTRQ